MTTLPLGYEPLKPRSLGSPKLVEDHSDQHLLTIAPTGSGKGVSCIIPALLSWPGPMVVIDPKGENYAVTADYRRSLGQDIYVLDPFAVATSATDRLNPLDLLYLPGSESSDDIASIVAMMMNGTTFTKDPFWDNRAETLLTGLLAFLVETHQTKASVQMLFARVNTTYEAIATTMRSMLGSETPEINAAGAVLDVNMSGKTGSSIVATAQMHISFLRNSAVGPTLCNSTVPLDDVMSGKPMTIYIVLPTAKLKTHAKLLRLWMGTILTVLSRRKIMPLHPTLLLLDEAAQLGELEELRTALTLMRGFGVKVWSFWQDMSQLRRLYPSDWQSLLNNSGVQQYFGAVSPFAAAEVDAYLMGMAPRSVFGMKPNEMVLLKDAAVPRMITRLDYLQECQFRSRASPNPYYPQPLGEVVPFKPVQLESTR